jgi:hypothetical protein
MELLRIVASKAPSKKWTAFFKNKETGKIKRTSFGSKGMDDYTLTHDKAQRDRYRKRHIKDLETHDFTRAGYLSYWILWGPYTSMDDNISYYKRKFNL